MSHHRFRWHRFWLGLCAVPFLMVEAPDAVAAKIKMAFPGPVTTFSLPYLVAQKKGWMDGLEVEDVHVTGDGAMPPPPVAGQARTASLTASGRGCAATGDGWLRTRSGGRRDHQDALTTFVLGADFASARSVPTRVSRSAIAVRCQLPPG